VTVDNPQLQPRPGITANAHIILAERTNALRIANAALRFRPPEGAPVVGLTNTAAGDLSLPKPEPVKRAASGPFAGLPEPPWSAEQRRPNPGEREQWLASLSPEDRDRAQKSMDEMRARRAQGGSGFGGGGGGGGGSGGGQGPGFAGGGGTSQTQRNNEVEGPRDQVLYLLEKQPTAAGDAPPALKAVTVKLGISDGATTEVLAGLKDGDLVVIGMETQMAASGQPANPFMRTPFGGPPRGR